MSSNYIEMRGYDGFYDNLVYILKKYFGTVENYCYERGIEDNLFDKFYNERRLSIRFIDALLRDGILERGEGKLFMRHELLVECALMRMLQTETPYQWMNRTGTHFTTYIDYFVLKDPMYSVTLQLLRDGVYDNTPLPYVRARRPFSANIAHFYEQKANASRSARKMLAKARTQWMNTEDLEALEAKLYERFGNMKKTIAAIGISYWVYYHFFRQFRYSHTLMRWLYAEGYVTSENLPPALEKPLREWCLKHGKQVKSQQPPKLLDERTLMPWQQVKVNLETEDDDYEPTDEDLAAIEAENSEEEAAAVAAEEARELVRQKRQAQYRATQSTGRRRGRPRKYQD